MTNLDECFRHPIWESFKKYMLSSGMWLPHWTWADAYDPKLQDYWWVSYWKTFLAGAEAQ